MKKFTFAVIGCLVLLIATRTDAEIPRTLSYQGIYTDTLGTPKPDGVYGFTFRLYETGSGGSAVWTQTKSLDVRRGLFHTVLGDAIPFGGGVGFDRQYWLSLQPGSDPELAPRIPLTSTGYSIRSIKSDTSVYALNAPAQAFVDSARIAGTIPDNSVTSNKIANNAVTSLKIADGSISTAKLLDDAVTSTKIADGAVATVDIADNAVTSGKIRPAQVVKSLNSLRDNITLSAAGGASITSSGDSIIITAGSGGGGTGVQSLQNTNNTMDIVNPTGPTVTVNIKNSGVTATQLADNSVTTNKILSAAVTPVKINSTGATGGQALTFDGSTVVWGNPSASLSLPYSGLGSASGNGQAAFNITNTSASGANYGVLGQANSTTLNAAGVRGVGNGTGQVIGVEGVALSGTSGTGVVGRGSATGAYFETSSNSGVGAYGVATAPNGNAYGLQGQTASSSGRGVFGLATATIGGTSGLYGQSASTDGAGVSGLATATSGSTYGLFGQSASTGGKGVFGATTATSGTNYGVWGQSVSPDGQGVRGVASSTTGITYGVSGLSASTSGTGVLGSAIATTGSTYGVLGQSASNAGSGVRGEASNSTGTAYGVSGSSVSSGGAGVYGDGPSRGVYGSCNSTYGVGVWGKSEATSGQTVGVVGVTSSIVGKGVWGLVESTSGTNFGVYGSTQSIDGYAGWFNQRVHVNGTLSKGGGSFKIDHPLDPENKYLYHSFVESPDMMNVYNGNVTLNAQGEAWVELPEWFEGLNKEFRYQLTAMGRPGPNLYIAEEIASNRFKIEGGAPGMKVSWQVTGIRKDAFAEKNRIPVEEQKTGEERGRYLHPDAFGQPQERGISWLHHLPELKRQEHADQKDAGKQQ